MSPDKDWKMLAARPGGRFICISLDELALKARGLLDDDEASRVLGIGNSGTAFAAKVRGQCPSLAVETVKFEAERSQRLLRIEPYDFRPVPVDDIAVSGLTMALAVEKIYPVPETAVVGLLYKSKTTRNRIGMDDLRPAAIYTRQGGGNPPINSLKTLQAEPERLQDLAKRYFGGFGSQFAQAVSEVGRE